VCYLGSDTELFRPLNFLAKRVVLSVGSLTPLKNFDFIIQALAEIPESSRPPLWIASNFQNLPERAYLETLAARLSVQVKFLGNISDDDLVRLYNTAAVAVYTPLREPFGLVPLEAMACETPVVTIREGGMQETILEGETGFMVGKSATELAEKIIYLLDNPQAANELGKNGRAMS
jgi:glycosyltransferase involved in cell wall biosynthesis